MTPAAAREPDGALRAVAIIPARLDSRRLAKKMLLARTGQYLFEHTARNVERCASVQRVVVATDSEEIAAASLGVAACCTMQSLMGVYFVHRFARGEVRDRLLPGALRGEVLGTICMTEPGAGSDLLGLTTRAEQIDGRWLVSGQKTWITAAPVADMFTVLARTGERELSLFLVERGAPGRELPKRFVFVVKSSGLQGDYLEPEGLERGGDALIDAKLGPNDVDAGAVSARLLRAQ